MSDSFDRQARPSSPLPRSMVRRGHSTGIPLQPSPGTNSTPTTCAGGTEESGSGAELKVDFDEAQVSAVSRLPL